MTRVFVLFTHLHFKIILCFWLQKMPDFFKNYYNLRKNLIIWIILALLGKFDNSDLICIIKRVMLTFENLKFIFYKNPCICIVCEWLQFTFCFSTVSTYFFMKQASIKMNCIKWKLAKNYREYGVANRSNDNIESKSLFWDWVLVSRYSVTVIFEDMS